ncbi:MAG: quinoprotein dehydrogenase-associated SoxYZ-like carrier [Paracoccus sp. (in: a-proteobacteria)]|uniref:quinoprotein dehydrogenase-associated SoxYZ-like carrier n=1 Tax=Paracoccus sp. TaxID=267 RepID=UPI0026DFD24E|nr:quinoprotein dehydrogenase-associated SoxYZ-like carrier [Paracoccus sp. (in: a-proteobacteria)]MDO5612756.1 quinoprotein dehydrogenase-associated SoxYZ-like carrier [Paracoccus sp. (in: a-proteobacteria)]
MSQHLLTAAAILLAAPALAQDNPLRPSPTWDDIRESVVGLDAPFRAHEAAIVPVRLTQPAKAPPITALALVIDENPAPVAAEYSFGPALMPLDFEMRVRVDSYSDVRAIAETPDGPVMAGRFVRASGGCSAPAGKDMAMVRETMGQMRWRSAPDGDRAIGTLMIRHPNFSGLQRDQLTLLTIPAHFIQTLEVKQGDAPLFTMEAGISVSEDPVFRFACRPDGQPIHVHVADTSGTIWEETFTSN